MISGEEVPSPFATLARHFFFSFFRLSFLDDAGEQSFKRGIIGLLSALVAMNLLLVRLYVGRYAGVTDASQLASMVAADRLFVIALPMFVTAIMMALIAQSIFPDDVDFRTLMALPLSQRTIFGAKFVALAAFAAIFIAGAVGGIALPLSLIINGRSHGEGPGLAVLIQLLVNSWSCAFVVAGAIGAQGLLAVALPRQRLRRVSLWLQTLTIGMLVLSIPLLLRAPGLGRALAQQPAWLFGVPPAWFLGAIQWLLGERDPYSTGLLQAAVGATMIAAGLCAICAALIYRRFDQSALRLDRAASLLRWNIPVRWSIGAHPVRAAIRDFVSATIRRSGLHQLVFASLFATGCALGANSLLGSIGLSERWAIQSVLTVPFTLMAGAVVGMRTALLLPTNVRAGWIFRLTEQASTRAYQLDAVRYALLFSGVAVPTALALPFQIGQLGIASATLILPIEILVGWAFVEIVCHEWRRIPFTCTFLFAKRPPANAFLLAITIFGWFPFIGAALLNVARHGGWPWMMMLTLAVSVALALRWWRCRIWGVWPMEFEDYLPDALEPLRLGE